MMWENLFIEVLFFTNVRKHVILHPPRIELGYPAWQADIIPLYYGSKKKEKEKKIKNCLAPTSFDLVACGLWAHHSSSELQRWNKKKGKKKSHELDSNQWSFGLQPKALPLGHRDEEKREKKKKEKKSSTPGSNWDSLLRRQECFHYTSGAVHI